MLGNLLNPIKTALTGKDQPRDADAPVRRYSAPAREDREGSHRTMRRERFLELLGKAWGNRSCFLESPELLLWVGDNESLNDSPPIPLTNEIEPGAKTAFELLVGTRWTSEQIHGTREFDSITCLAENDAWVLKNAPGAKKPWQCPVLVDEMVDLTAIQQNVLRFIERWYWRDEHPNVCVTDVRLPATKISAMAHQVRAGQMSIDEFAATLKNHLPDNPA